MSMRAILSIAVALCHGQQVTMPAMTKRELSDLLDALAVLRREIGA